jgi:hypothetical protein
VLRFCCPVLLGVHQVHNRRASEILVSGLESVRVGVNLLRHLAPGGQSHLGAGDGRRRTSCRP